MPPRPVPRIIQIARATTSTPPRNRPRGRGVWLVSSVETGAVSRRNHTMRRRLLAIPLMLLASVVDRRVSQRLGAGHHPTHRSRSGCGHRDDDRSSQSCSTASDVTGRISASSPPTATGAAVMAAAAEGDRPLRLRRWRSRPRDAWGLTFLSGDLVMEGSATLAVAAGPATPATPTTLRRSMTPSSAWPRCCCWSSAGPPSSSAAGAPVGGTMAARRCSGWRRAR